jgi:dTDP-4-dehydrorhamnose 3,5-epimerase
VKVHKLAVPGALAFTSPQFPDDRGLFLEWFRQDTLTEAVGYPLTLAQANCSVSHRGVLRGVHYADVPPGQAKYVTCVRGAVLDVVVDLRVGSPSFGRSDAVSLDDRGRTALFLPVGVGHAFLALSDDATVVYLCDTGYTPAAEHGVHPLDPGLGLPWPTDVPPVFSPRDAAAPTLAEALAAGALPSHAACVRREEELRRAAGGPRAGGSA